MIHEVQSTFSNHPLPKKSRDEQQSNQPFATHKPEPTPDQAVAAPSQINTGSLAFIQQQVIEEALARMQLEMKSRAAPPSEEPPIDDARQAFLDYMNMTDNEKIRAAILSQLDLTEEELAGLPPEERERIEAIIEQRIEALVERKNAEQIEITG